MLSMAWSVVFLNRAVEAEVENLPEDMQARLTRIVELIKGFGLPAMREPHVKHLTGKLWEIRLSGRAGIGRVIYAAAIGQRVVLLRAFVKKSQKTPDQEIEIALNRLKEIKQ
jgi:phage-related protein